MILLGHDLSIDKIKTGPDVIDHLFPCAGKSITCGPFRLALMVICLNHPEFDGKVFSAAAQHVPHFFHHSGRQVFKNGVGESGLLMVKLVHGFGVFQGEGFVEGFKLEVVGMVSS